MANTKIQSEQIADSAIVTDRIAADAVTTAKIADNVALGGSPTTTTQSASDNSTKIATTEYVTTAISSLIDSAPSTLNTLNEIAAALNDDANFNTTVTNSIAAKLPLAGGTITGTVVFNSAPTFNTAITMGSTLNVASTVGIAGTTVIDSSRNLTNIGTISSGAITSSGNVTASGNILVTGTSKIAVTGQTGTDYLEFDDDSATYQNNTNLTVLASKSGLVLRTNTNDGGGGKFSVVTGDSSPTTLLEINNSNNLSTFAGNVSVSGTTLTVGAGSGSDPTGDIVINDVAGAKYKIETGSYDLDFMKHDADASAYVSALKIIGANANDGTPDVRVQYQLGVGADPTEALEVNGSIVCSGFTDEEGIFFRSGFSNSNKYNVSILAKDHNGSSADGLSINGYDGITFCTGANTRNEVVRINGGTANPGFVKIAPNSATGDATSRLDIIGNSDNGDADVTLKITDLDSTSGSVVPQIQFRSGSADIGRIRVNDVLGMLLSGSGSNEDDLVLKGGKLSNSKPGASSAVNASDADVQLAGRHIWKRITPNSTKVTTTASAQFKIAFYRGNDGSNYRTCYYKGVYVIVNAGGYLDWSGHGYVTHRSELLINFYSTTSGRATFDLNRGRSYLQNNDSNMTVDSVTFSYDSNYLYATFNMITNESGDGWNPFYNVEVIDTDDSVASCSAV